MKKVITILFLINSLNCVAQPSNTATAKPLTKSTFGIFASPEICFGSFVRGNNYGPSLTGKINGGPAISAGLSYRYRAHKNVFIESGLTYGRKFPELTLSGLVLGSAYDPVNGTYKESTLQYQSFIQEFQIPVLVGLTTSKKQFFVACGIDLVYVFQNKAQASVYEDNILIERYDIPKGKKEVNTAFVLSAGYNLLRKDRLLFSFAPIVKYSIKDYNNARLLNFGLKTSFWF